MKIKTVFMLLTITLFSTQISFAADCGQKPDPWPNPDNLAHWCSCTGKSFDAKSLDCKGVSQQSTPSQESTAAANISANARANAEVNTDTTSKGGDWFCVAYSASGACGYGLKYESAESARDRAISECEKYSHGEKCKLKYCSTNPPADPCEMISSEH
jgi:hypothetical protein